MDSTSSVLRASTHGDFKVLRSVATSTHLAKPSLDESKPGLHLKQIKQALRYIKHLVKDVKRNQTDIVTLCSWQLRALIEQSNCEYFSSNDSLHSTRVLLTAIEHQLTSNKNEQTDMPNLCNLDALRFVTALKKHVVHLDNAFHN